MNIAIDISPLHTSQHSVRGVGSYIRNLQTALKKVNSSDTITFLSSLQRIASNVDILHIPYFDPFFLHLPLIKKYPTVVTIHDLIPLVFPQHFPRGLKGEVKWQIQKNLVKKCDVIITDSHASKNDIVEILNIEKDRVKVVYLAADDLFTKVDLTDEQKKYVEKKYSIPKTFILYVGDVTWNKNLPRLAKAIKLINIPLVTIGKAITQDTYDRGNAWNRDVNEFQQLSKEANNILNLGYIENDDLVKLYNLATALVLPSIYEGFGLPVLEAMSCGTPVITSKKGSLSEVGGDACYYIDPMSVQSIAEGISKVCSSSSLRNELSEKGLIQARKFTWEKTADETINIYQDLYKRSR